MPGALAAKTPEKSSTSLVIRVGSHPVVYGTMTVLAIGAAAFFFAIVPMVRLIEPGGSYSVSDAKSKNASIKSKLDTQSKLIEAVSGISKKDQDLLAYALPSEPDAPGLIIQLNSVAIKSGVRMTGVDVSGGSSDSSSPAAPDQGMLAGAAPAQPSQNVKTLTIAYTVSGITYDKLKILLSNLESSLRLFDVLSLSYSPTSGSVSLELRTYYIANS